MLANGKSVTMFDGDGTSMSSSKCRFVLSIKRFSEQEDHRGIIDGSWHCALPPRGGGGGGVVLTVLTMS